LPTTKIPLPRGQEDRCCCRRSALPLHGSANRYDHRDGNDDYTQAGNLFRSFDAEQRQRLFQNIAAAMQGVPDAIKRRQIALFDKCDPAFGAGVAKAVELDPPHSS
jgi:catalase